MDRFTKTMKKVMRKGSYNLVKDLEASSGEFSSNGSVNTYNNFDEDRLRFSESYDDVDDQDELFLAIWCPSKDITDVIYEDFCECELVCPRDESVGLYDTGNEICVDELEDYVIPTISNIDDPVADESDDGTLMEEQATSAREQKINSCNDLVCKSWYLEKPTNQEDSLGKLPIFGHRTLMPKVKKRTADSKIVHELVVDRFKKPRIPQRIKSDSAHSYQDLSIGTSNISQLISFVPEQSTLAESFVKTSKLLEEANIQSQIMLQTTKALRITKPGSLEEVEGQRILLIAQLKREAILAEISNTTFEQSSVSENVTVVIKSISLRQKLSLPILTRNRNYFTYFVCIASMGPKVLSTRIAKDEQIIVFNDELNFDDLTSFSVTLSVYSLRISEQKIASRQRESSWMKFKKMFKRGSGSSDSTFEFYAKTKFILIGKCNLNKGNMITKPGNFMFTDMAVASHLDRQFELEYDVYY